MNSHTGTLFIACCCAMAAGTLRAQDRDIPDKGWTFDVASLSGTANSMAGVEAAVRIAGFRDNSLIQKYPWSDETGQGFQFTVRRRFGEAIYVAAVGGRSSLGETHGWKSTGSHGEGESIILKKSVVWYGAMAGVSTAVGDKYEFLLSAGPAYYRAEVVESTTTGGQTAELNRLGLLAAAGVAWTFGRGLFLEAQGQYSIIGNVTVDTFDLVGRPETIPGSSREHTVEFSHYALLFGIGVRL